MDARPFLDADDDVGDDELDEIDLFCPLTTTVAMTSKMQQTFSGLVMMNVAMTRCYPCTGLRYCKLSRACPLSYVRQPLAYGRPRARDARALYAATSR